jgi:DNA repair protein RecO (recombination protein O)
LIRNMPAASSESLILRTYPYGEANLVVSFFTRDQGKLRGVARSARKPKSKFGASLERLTHSRVYYNQQENRELLFISSCEVLQSQFSLASDYEAGLALDHIAEVSDLLLPPGESNERFFRLILAVLEDLRAGAPIWRPVLYHLLWAVRLAGILGDPAVSEASGELAREILTRPVRELSPRDWNKATARDLRRWLVRDIEQHAERRIQSGALLESL